MHNCAECGIEHEAPEPEVVVEEAVDTEPVAEAEVRVAEINANRDIAVAKIAARSELQVTESEAELLRAEMRGIREMVERLMPSPDPEPAPVVIEEPEPEPEMEIPPKEEHHEPKAPSRPKGFF